jgi:hypothetical protein
MRVPFLCVPLIVFAATLVHGQDTNFSSGPQYLMTGSPLFARSISTPSTTLEGPPLDVGASNATGVLIAGAENQTPLPPRAVDLPNIDLFPIYYGGALPSVIEISSVEPSSELFSTELPASILDTGVWQVTTAQALRESGYGVTLAVAAAYEKAHARHATHVYTNTDIDHLRGGS